MGNQNTTTFQTLKELPTPLSLPQCVLHKHELLICGSYKQRACYSYHTLKNEYKFICDYPSHTTLDGHCVVKLVDNNNCNQITLLSFGGLYSHTLVMKYVSVWGNMSNKSNEFNNCNQWVPFTYNQNQTIVIGRDQGHDFQGVRAVIGGCNNNLLFITYYRNNISVFDLNTFQFIKHDKLPIDYIQYHCFVSKSENREGQEMMKTNKQNYQMLLFCYDAGLSIEYDEDNSTFQFLQLNVCDDIVPFNLYAYVCINDIILFFGGWNHNHNITSKSVHKYSIRENRWMTFQNALPSPLFHCVAILNEEDNLIHIIGGRDDEKKKVSAHMKTNVRTWDLSQLVMICLFIIYLF
ncbi:hypothetical protein RFI_25037 [Reticulomyxa filosa]|uniref:Kelch motif family protein n=1 Tax=Reticulomyxa filosa TaxID=46433 RepID=X6MH13_RETFI|nr:hypothetical protein RFI_25037 [Reticulomyxa filosa]|eukprot:ETO12340.1 hypothetical protein RFI_25037 [Reticulomyxa filosa]